MVAGCAPDEEDAGLILLLADRPARAIAGRPPTSVKLRLPDPDDRDPDGAAAHGRASYWSSAGGFS
jgi:hypothetical protein